MNWLRRELIEHRPIQAGVVKEIAAKGQNVAVVMDTAAGKTIIAFEVANDFLAKGKVVFFAPNTNLARQNYERILKFFSLDPAQVELITGTIPPHKRGDFWRRAQFISATPETLVNDFAHGRVNADDFALFIFDEFHQGGEKYAYTDLSIIAHKNNITRLGLSATPGVDDAELDRVLAQLRLTELVVRTAESTGLSEHTWPKYEFKRIVPLTAELKYYAIILELRLEDILKSLRDFGCVNGAQRILSVRDLKAVMDKARKLVLLDDEIVVTLNKRILTLAAEYFKLRHFLSVLVTENYLSAWKFYQELLEEAGRSQPIRASKRIVTDLRFNVVIDGLRKKVETGESHPKTLHLIDILYRLLYGRQQIIIFCNDKNSQLGILQAMEAHTGLRGRAKVVHSETSKRGKAETQRVLEAFKTGEVPILISTSILEAGIDIPVVDTIINYSLPLEEATMIQRRGRVGRFKDGYIYYLAMEHKFDLSLLYASFAKTRKMLFMIRNLAKDIKPSRQLSLW